MHDNTVSYNSKIYRFLVASHSEMLKKFTNLTLQITHSIVKEQLGRVKLGIYTEEENVRKSFFYQLWKNVTYSIFFLSLTHAREPCQSADYFNSVQNGTVYRWHCNIFFFHFMFDKYYLKICSWDCHLQYQHAIFESTLIVIYAGWKPGICIAKVGNSVR